VDDADRWNSAVERRDVIVLGVSAAEVEVAFIVNDEWGNAAGDGMLRELLKGGVPEAADRVPWLEVGTDKVAPLAVDGIH